MTRTGRSRRLWGNCSPQDHPIVTARKKTAEVELTGEVPIEPADVEVETEVEVEEEVETPIVAEPDVEGPVAPVPGRKSLGVKEVIPFKWKVIGRSGDAVLTLFKSVEREDTDAQFERAQREGYYTDLQVVEADFKIVQPVKPAEKAPARKSPAPKAKPEEKPAPAPPPQPPPALPPAAKKKVAAKKPAPASRSASGTKTATKAAKPAARKAPAKKASPPRKTDRKAASRRKKSG